MLRNNYERHATYTLRSWSAFEYPKIKRDVSKVSTRVRMHACELHAQIPKQAGPADLCSAAAPQGWGAVRRIGARALLFPRLSALLCAHTQASGAVAAQLLGGICGPLAAPHYAPSLRRRRGSHKGGRSPKRVAPRGQHQLRGTPSIAEGRAHPLTIHPLNPGKPQPVLKHARAPPKSALPTQAAQRRSRSAG